MYPNDSDWHSGYERDSECDIVRVGDTVMVHGTVEVSDMVMVSDTVPSLETPYKLLKTSKTYSIFFVISQ